MTTVEIKNEIIEKMLDSKWVEVYANKLNRKFGKYSTKDYNPSRDSLISNLWEALLIYERNNSLDASYQSIERYCFQKAFTLTSEEFISDLGKYRQGKKKEWQQVKVQYIDEIHAKEFYFDEYPGLENEYIFDDTQLTSNKNKAFAIDIAEDKLTKSQATFVKSVLSFGVDGTMQNLELNSKSFNNRLNRTIKAIQKKKDKYEVVSSRANKLNTRLDLINHVVSVIEDENSNEIKIYKALALMFESSIGYLYNKAFNSIDKEIALQAFKENDGRQFAYKLCNAIYDEKAKIENELKAVA